ncbi:hypothetical protein [uncultured Christiangramia sp.]|uniref:hypothetical protein n=1 Tax=uncultured Christiangramia sp. TaxID=503836 RepID=UPI00260FC13D|nr:hypothetical protein [uncultured Christiangramia sp.]
MRFLIIFMALYISFQSAEKEKAETTSETKEQNQEVELNVFSASLCLGDELKFGDRRIKFREIISDSRCPSNPIVMCIWAGQVRVKVDVYEKREFVGSIEFSGIQSMDHLFGDSKELKISLVNVKPYPVNPGKIPAEDYMVSFRLTEVM